MNTKSQQERITSEYVSSILSYDPETGLLTWLVRKAKRIRVGDIPGNGTNSDGYHQVMFDGKHHKAHRIAWLLYHGTNPEGEIDHINGIRTDNRINNLRCVTKQENIHNQRKAHRRNLSGYLGAHYHTRNKRWSSNIRVDNKLIHLGYFADQIEAHNAYVEAKKIYHNIDLTKAA